MSHDRGCPCGREKWDYEECYQIRRGMCFKEDIVKGWMKKQWGSESTERKPALWVWDFS